MIIVLKLSGEFLECRLITDGSLTCGDDYEEMVFVDLLGQRRQLVPVLHLLVVGTRGGMNVLNILADERQRVLSAVELDAAFQIGGHAGQTVNPAVESRLVFSPAWHSHLNAAYGVERLSELCNHNLTVQLGEQAFGENAPERVFLVFLPVINNSVSYLNFNILLSSLQEYTQ